MSIWAAVGLLAICFLVLTKSASWFVDGAVGVAEYLNVPKTLIGIVLVSLATTAPELAVSVLSSLSGNPEIALGNAVGSVIADDGVALGLGALVAGSPILVNPYLLKTTGIFLIVVDLAAYAMAFDGTLNRAEGMILVALFGIYCVFAYVTRHRSSEAEREQMEGLAEIEEAVAGRGLGMLMLWFGVGLVGVVLSSEGIVRSTVTMAEFLGVSKAVIGLTVVAIGTSLPEIATAVTAARKGHGGIVVGNILGADVLNICWIAGASAVVNPLVVPSRVIHFSFPAMLVIVGAMLVMMRTRHRLARGEGMVLLALYALYSGLVVRLLL